MFCCRKPLKVPLLYFSWTSYQVNSELPRKMSRSFKARNVRKPLSKGLWGYKAPHNLSLAFLSWFSTTHLDDWHVPMYTSLFHASVAFHALFSVLQPPAHPWLLRNCRLTGPDISHYVKHSASAAFSSSSSKATHTIVGDPHMTWATLR